MYECVDNNDCSDGSVSSAYTHIFALLDDNERDAKCEKQQIAEQHVQVGVRPSWILRRPKLSGSAAAAPLPGDSELRCIFLGLVVPPNNVTQVMVMVVPPTKQCNSGNGNGGHTKENATQDDAECWEERGDKCCYDFSDFNGETLNSIGR